MRLRLLAPLALALLAGCQLPPSWLPEGRKLSRWGPPINLLAPIAFPEHTARESRGHLIDEVSVYGYDRGVTLHFSLRDHHLADLLDAAGGLPPRNRRGRAHLGTVRAKVAMPGGEGYAFSFHNMSRRRAMALLAELCGRSIIVGSDVLDTIDVEVEGAPPFAVLRLLADEGGCVILEDHADDEK